MMAWRPRISSWRDLDPVRFGIVVAVIVGAGLTFAFSLGTLDLLEDRYGMSAAFRDTGGIDTGDDVRVAGVSVGQVTGVHPDFDTGQIIVAFEVDDGIVLGADTRADVATATLLGGYYLRLTTDAEVPHLHDLDADDPARRIPLERTSTPVSVISAVSDTTEQIQAIDVDAMNQVLGQLAGATGRNADVVPELLDNLTLIGDAIAEREDEIRSLVTNASQVSEVLASRDAEIIALIDAADVLLARVAERRDQLATVLGDGSTAVAALTAQLDTHRSAIDSLLADGHVLAQGVERNLSTVNTSLAWAGPFFELLSATVDEEGGFNVAVEGAIVSVDQLQGIVDLLLPSGGVG